MIKKILFILTFLPIILSFPLIKPHLDFKIISSNVRVDTHSRFFHEHKWNERKQHLTELLLEHSTDKPTIIGLQELKYHQLKELLEIMNNNETNGGNDNGNWNYYGIGRDNGHKKGEFAPIFYQDNKWELINSTTKWLSETPDIPSKFWDAACYRIVSITTFKNLETGIFINMLNTHYDHISEQARGKSLELIINWINSIPNNYKTFLSGDFNSIYSDASYQTLIKRLNDSKNKAENILSQMKTYTGFEPEMEHTVIDFIWCDDNVKVKNYNVIDTWTEQGFRSSDHRPVVVEFDTY